MEKIWVLAFQKVAKTGNIGKKSPVAGGIDNVRYLSMQKVKVPSCPILPYKTKVLPSSQNLPLLWCIVQRSQSPSTMRGHKPDDS